MGEVSTSNDLSNRFTRASWLLPLTVVVVMGVLFIHWAINWWRIGTNGFDPWGVGDWLLSFDGGFVRRGLFGSLVLSVTPEASSIVTTVVVAQIILMGALFALLFALFMRTSRSLTWAMVLLSPATLVYFTIAITNDQAGPRKELVVMVALALVALGFRRPSWHWWAVGGLVLFVLATWSHEASALVLPAFVYLIYTGSVITTSASRVWRQGLIGAYSLVAAGVVVLAILFPGNADIQQGICEAWAARGVAAECQGQALGALTLTTEAAVEWFRTQLFPRYWGYLPIVALAVIPLYAVRFLPKNWRVTLVVLVFLAPLFYIAWDYGRWIYLAAMTLSILALATSSTTDAPEPMRVPLIAILAYCLLWGFPGYSNEPPVLYDGWLVDWLQNNVPTAWF